MDHATKQRVANLLVSDDPDLRRLAAEDLADRKELAVISALASAITDEDKGVRDAASRSLNAIGTPNVARAIVEYIGDQNITTRNLAADILLRLGKDAIHALIPFLHDPNHDVRKFAVDILGLLKAEEAVEQLVKLLHDPDENVVISAVESLGNVGSSRAIRPLTLLYEEVEYTRGTIAEAFGKIGDPVCCDFLLLKMSFYLTTRVYDPVVLFAIIEALGVIGNEQAYKILINHAHDVKGKLRRALLASTVQIAERKGISLKCPQELKTDFLEALHDDDIVIKASAVKSLADYDDAEVHEAFIALFGLNEELDIRMHTLLEERESAFELCVRELTRGASGKKQIIKLLGSLAVYFVQMIVKREEIEVSEEIMTLAFDVTEQQWDGGDEETRSAIVDTLFHLDGDRAVAFLDTIMNDPDPWLRIHVIELLGIITDRRIPQFLTRFLNDEDEMVREVVHGTLLSRGFSIDNSEIIEQV